MRASIVSVILVALIALTGCTLPKGFLLPDSGEDPTGDPAAIVVDCPACTDNDGNRFAGPAPLEVGFSAANYEQYPDYRYTWEFDDNGAASTRPDAEHTFQDVGFYEITLTVEDEDKTFTNSVLIRAESPDEPQEPEHLSNGENNLIEAELLAKRNNFDDTQLQVRLLLTAKRELQSCYIQIFARVGGSDSISGKEWEERWPQGNHPVQPGGNLDYRGSADIDRNRTVRVSARIHCAEPGWGAEGAELKLDELVVE